MNYMELQRILRLEKKNPGLTKVDNDFYKNLREILTSPEITEDKETHERISDIICQILTERKKKIINHALRIDDTPPLNSTKEEEDLFRKVATLLKKFDSEVLELEKEIGTELTHHEEVAEKTIEEEKKENQQIKEDENSFVRVRFLKAMPAFIGSDTKTYGPFEKDDEAKIPINTAKILLERGVVEES